MYFFVGLLRLLSKQNTTTRPVSSPGRKSVKKVFLKQTFYIPLIDLFRTQVSKKCVLFWTKTSRLFLKMCVCVSFICFKLHPMYYLFQIAPYRLHTIICSAYNSFNWFWKEKHTHVCCESFICFRRPFSQKHNNCWANKNMLFFC